MKDDTPFILECPGCHTRYEIPVSIPEGGRKVRCAGCSHIWVARPGDEFRLGEPEPFPEGAGHDVVFRDQDRMARAGEAAGGDEAAFGEAAVPEAGPEPQGSAPRDAEPDAFAAALAEAESEVADETGASETESDGSLPGEEDFAETALEAEDAGFEPDPVLDETEPVDAGAGAENEAGSEAALEPDVSQATDAAPLNDLDAGDEVEVFYGDPAEAPALPEDPSPSGKVEIGKARRRRAFPGRVAAGWLGLLAAVAGLGALAVGQRAEVVRMLPGTAWAFEAAGMPVNVRGLDFRDVAYSWETDAGQVVLEVHGDIVNITSADLAVPSLVLGLRDETEKEVYQWEEEVMGGSLAAGDSATFAIRIPTPPKSVKSVQVRFAKAR